MKSLVIGEGISRVIVDPPLILAPMAGHTDVAFRALVRHLGGCGLVVTEMVSSEGLTRGGGHSRRLAEITDEERPVAIQIFGSDPGRMADAAAMVESFGASLVDVNMGCPVPKVTRTGAGAALMRDVGRAAQVVAAVVRATRIPVTAKIRSGWDKDHINAPEVASALEDAGAAAITVHPRCRSERHRGRSAWEVIADVKRVVTIPVIGNGDVSSAADVRDITDETGADGVMLGRAALSNPWVFGQIGDEISGIRSAAPTPEDYGEALGFIISRLQIELSEKRLVNRVKALTGWLTKGFPKGAELRSSVYTAGSLAEMTAAFDEYFTTQTSDGLSMSAGSQRGDSGGILRPGRDVSENG